METSRRLNLDELEQLSGVPARQIRELIRLGVIPAPSSRGRGATYGPEHADRLRAWKRLRADAPAGTTNEHLRALIDRLADQGLLRGIADGSVPFAMIDDGNEQVALADASTYADAVMLAPNVAGSETNEEALNYLARMRRRPEPARVRLQYSAQPTLEVDIRAAKRAGPALALRRLRAALEEYTASSGDTVRVNASKSEIWHRVSATRDIEIAARGPLTPDEIQLLETIGQLLQQAIYHKER
jgi:DNA-binding transcriptional MerR regulator